MYNFDMRILLLSNSNGATLNIQRAIEKTSPDIIFHLGGNVNDIASVRTDIPVYITKGPHDLFVNAPKVAKILLDKTIAVYTYGKIFDTDKQLTKLTNFAKNEKAKLVFYADGPSGYFERQGIVFVNPGKINKKENRYAIVDITKNKITVFHDSVAY